MLNRVADYLPVGLGSPPKPKPAALPVGNLASHVSLRGVVETVEKLVKNHPGAALGAAFIVGVSVAWWIKRR